MGLFSPDQRKIETESGSHIQDDPNKFKDSGNFVVWERDRFFGGTEIVHIPRERIVKDRIG